MERYLAKYMYEEQKQRNKGTLTLDIGVILEEKALYRRMAGRVNFRPNPGPLF